MRRAWDWVRWFAARLGWPGLLGAVLLASGAFSHQVLVPTLQAETQALQAQIATARERRLQQPEPAADAAEAQPLADARETPEAIGRLFKAASRAGLALEAGEYRLQSGQGLLRYQIQLPLQGRYPPLRSFLSDSLNGNPGLALDSLNLSRERVEDAELKAVLRFTLYLDAGAAR